MKSKNKAVAENAKEKVGHQKKDQKKNIKKKVCSTCIILRIYLGNRSYIKAIFYSLIGKNYFPYLRSLSEKDKQMFLDDLSQEVVISIWRYLSEGNIANILYPKAYIKGIIYNKFSDENKRLSKLVIIKGRRQWCKMMGLD